MGFILIDHKITFFPEPKIVFRIFPIKQVFKYKRILKKLPKSAICERKHFYESLNVTGDYVRIDNSTRNNYDFFFLHEGEESDYVKTVTTLNATWVCLEDMYVNSMSTFGDNKNFYGLWKFERLNELYDERIGTLASIQEYVIALGHQNAWIYGHFYLDVLVPLMMFPENIIQKSKIIINRMGPFTIELFRAVGVSDSQVLISKKYEWHFVNHLYVCENPIPHASHFGPVVVKLADKLRNAFGIKEFKPKLFVVFNRAPGYFRHFNDTVFNVIMNRIKVEFPDKDWTYVNDIYPTQRETALVWSNIKFMFTLTGSHLVRMIFMQKDSYICDVQANYMDYAMMGIAITMHVNILAFSESKNRHFDHSYDIDINKSIYMIKILMYAYNKGKWPDRDKWNY